MKSVLGVFIIAVVLFVAGVVCLSEARVVRRMAADHRRVAIFQYDDNQATATSTGLIDRLSLPLASRESVESQRASADYWRARYEALMPLTGLTGSQQTNDPNVLLIAANATFRVSNPETGNVKGTVERLDSVIQAYGDVLRGDPNNFDAAYNYEYVSRLRDVLAKGRPAARPKDQKIALSTDLPVGPTLHGRPGGPPPEVPMANFKTFSPLQNDERGDLMERERTPVSRRKG
jgi:hypothetical protein